MKPRKRDKKEDREGINEGREKGKEPKGRERVRVHENGKIPRQQTYYFRNDLK